jgi:hypothetical protein
MAAPSTELVDTVVDTNRYPLTEPTGPGWRAAVDRVRSDLAEVGCCVLADFLRPEVRPRLGREGAEIAPLAHHEVSTVNAYNIDPDTPLPADHPARITMRRGNAFVARDRIPASFLIARLYADPVFQRFLAECFGLPALHELVDPLSGLVLNVVRPGMGHPWHFDLNEFTVTMLTQRSEQGGAFEYCPNIRSERDEHLDDVRAVLEGGAEHLIRRLDLRPGDLQLFRGRYSLHRVSTVAGERDRHTAIFAYSDRPGVLGTATRARQLFGRVAEEHVTGRSVRGDDLLD